MENFLKETRQIYDDMVIFYWLWFHKVQSRVLELVDAVQAQHVTLDISVYYTIVAEPYFIFFHSA